MKTSQILKLVTVLMLSTASSLAHASDGGNGSGGGNVQPSTRADLEEIVRNIGESAWEITDDYLTGGPITLTSEPLSAQLQSITSAVLGSKTFSVHRSFGDYVRELKFNITDQPCLDGIEERDASTSKQVNSPVCLSATRLSRFPKSGLKDALLPLIFHEIAHQYGFGEDDANAFQKLASVHLLYRPIYLESRRAMGTCGFLTKKPLTGAEKADLASLIPAGSKIFRGHELQVLQICSANGALASADLERNFNGDVWAKEATNLTVAQQNVLNTFARSKEFSFMSISRSLGDASSGTNCAVGQCKPGGIDRPYILFLAGKAAMKHIDITVGQLQNLIAK